ncbi:hypothetical protein ES703_111289 [subsurface metagenome]
MDAHCIHVFDKANGYLLAFCIADDFELQFLPSENGLFDEDLSDKTYRQPPGGHSAQLFDVEYCTAAGAAHGVCRADDDGVTKLFSDLFSFFYAKGQFAFWHLDSEPVHRFFEGAAVLATLNSVNLNANYFDAVFFEHACMGKLGRQIESALAAKIWQEGVGPFLFDDFCHSLEVKRLDIGCVGQAGVGHNGCRVGIDQHYLIA